jgi:hypothetical protein
MGGRRGSDKAVAFIAQKPEQGSQSGTGHTGRILKHTAQYCAGTDVPIRNELCERVFGKDDRTILAIG